MKMEHNLSPEVKQVNEYGQGQGHFLFGALFRWDRLVSRRKSSPELCDDHPAPE